MCFGMISQKTRQIMEKLNNKTSTDAAKSDVDAETTHLPLITILQTVWKGLISWLLLSEKLNVIVGKIWTSNSGYFITQ